MKTVSTAAMPTALRSSIASSLIINSTTRFNGLQPSLLFPSSSSSSSFLRLSKGFSNSSSSRSRLPSLTMASLQPPQSTQTVSPGEVESETDIYQLIQAHQIAAARLSPIEEVRTVLDRSTRGTLSTYSQKYQGYPSGSMVDFACDTDGTPILAISSLALHTKQGILKTGPI
ncbi:hypothetical protein AQUCO_00400740v1 [Aquilegia coerulea]|uniref:Uncharacterized protein n=1 Tax=Aquilegia coerulea TaxID=218851 RepID=A0A2G5EWG4_AQUCA|nr:hypothetical protein AQUCO_00400740v1 [Aquilegia coerulea]